MRKISWLFLLLLLPLKGFSQERKDESAFPDSAAMEKPPLKKWTTHRLGLSEIMHVPFRGLDRYFSLVPGAVQVNNELHIRGSRPYETAFLLDGFNVTNPFFGSSGLILIPEAIEVLDVHTGAFGAELGSATGGIVATTMRTGGEKLEFSADIRSDDVVRPGSRFLNTTPLGYKNFVGTIGGPLPALEGMEIRFFLAGEHTFYRNRQTMFLDPFRYDNLQDDGLWRSINLGRSLPSSVEFKQNWLPDNWLKRTTLQGNAVIEFGDAHLKLLGSYNEQENLEGRDWPNALTNYFNQERSMLTRTTTKFGAVEIGYAFSPLVSGRAAVYFYDRFERTFDRDFRHNWFDYADSTTNAKFYGTSEWLNRYSGPDPYSTIYAFRFTAHNTPNNTYSKNRQSNIGVSFDLQAEATPMLTLNFGVKFDSWTMRLFRVRNISGLRKFLDSNLDGIPDAVFASDFEERIRFMDRGGIDAFGYTFHGTESDGYTLAGAPAGAILDKPYRPVFGSVFASASMTSSDLNLEAGLRYEYFDPNFKMMEQTLNPNVGYYDYGDDWRPYSNMDYNVALGIIDESQIRETDPSELFLPRIGASFVVDDGTAFFASYGRYAQLPRLDFLYLSSYGFSRAVAPENRTPYAGGLSFPVRPELSTHFEIGVKRQLLPGLTVTGSLYRKSLNGQVQIDQMIDGIGNPMFTLYRNNGQGISKGIEIGVELARRQGFAASAHFAFSSSDGYTSHPLSNARQVSDSPLPASAMAMYPYDYDQPLRGSAVVSYRIDDESDPLVDGLDVTSVLSFNSGHSFTREEGVRTISPGPWVVGVHSLKDVRFVSSVEPPNSSTTPSFFNVDVRISKKIVFTPVTLTLSLSILNVLNSKNVINVYPTTGSANDDSWFSSPFEGPFEAIPNYESFYRDINLKNRWAYSLYSGNDIYGTPREIQFGVAVEM